MESMDAQTGRATDVSAGEYYCEAGERVGVPADFVRDLPTEPRYDHREAELPRPTAEDKPVRATSYPEEAYWWRQPPGRRRFQWQDLDSGADWRQLSRIRDPYWGEPDPGADLPADSETILNSEYVSNRGESYRSSARSVYRHASTASVVDVLGPMLEDSTRAVRTDVAESLLRAIEDQPWQISAGTFSPLCTAVGRRDSAQALLDIVASHPDAVPPDLDPSLLSLRRYVSEDRVVTAVSTVLSQNIDSAHGWSGREPMQEEVDLGRTNLSGATLRRATPPSSTLVGGNLSMCDLLDEEFPPQMSISNRDITGTDLSGAGFTDAAVRFSIEDQSDDGRSEMVTDLSGCGFTGATVNINLDDETRVSNLETIDFSNALLEDTTLEIANGYRESDRHGEPIFRAQPPEIDFTGVELSNVDLGIWFPGQAIFVDANLSGIDLSGWELSKVDFTGSDLTKADLHEADLRNSTLTAATLSEASLRDATLRGASLVEADARGAVFAGADLSGSDLSDSDLVGAVLTGADLSSATVAGADLTDVELTGAVLSGVDLTNATVDGDALSMMQSLRATVPDHVRDRFEYAGSNFSECDLSDLDLAGIDLSGADLSGVELSGTSLADAELQGTDLSDANILGTDLTDANLSEADLTDADCGMERSLLKLFGPGRRTDARGADLSGATLAGTKLVEVVLAGADLSGADLGRVDATKADFSSAVLDGADLSGANLSDSDLSDATLESADLTNADLSGADLQSTDFQDAKLDGAVLPDT